ncbi:MAG: hypothetical protein FWG43_06005 [Clostridiales bacterium]|nr:hypothetical protein [Clostridiales bacterium]
MDNEFYAVFTIGMNLEIENAKEHVRNVKELLRIAEANLSTLENLKTQMGKIANHCGAEYIAANGVH